MGTSEDLVKAQQKEAQHAKESAKAEKASAAAEAASAQAQKGPERVAQPNDFSIL